MKDDAERQVALNVFMEWMQSDPLDQHHDDMLAEQCDVIITALQQKPAVLEGERAKALAVFDDGFDSYEKREYALNGPQTGKAEGQLYFFWPEDVAKIKSALQSSAVEAVPEDTAEFVLVPRYKTMAMHEAMFDAMPDKLFLVSETDDLWNAAIRSWLKEKIITDGTGE